MKICTKCKREKPKDQFSLDPKGRDGRCPRCRECSNSYARAWTKANPDKRKESQIKNEYGISLAEKDAMIKSQGGGCAICASTTWGSRGPQIDHCHDTGRIRGVLCEHCNRGLGSFKDAPSSLRTAALYLESI